MEVFENDQFQPLIDMIMGKDGFFKHNHIVDISIQKGVVRAEIEVTDGMLNSRGTVHGGSLYAICDTIGGLAAMTYGYDVTTSTGTIAYIRPAVGTHFYAETVEIKAGSKLSRFDVLIKNCKDEIVCKAMMEYFNLGPLELG